MSLRGHNYKSYMRQAELLGYSVKYVENVIYVKNEYEDKEFTNKREFARWVLNQEVINKAINKESEN